MSQLKFISENFVVRCRGGILKLVEQCGKLVNRHLFPLLEVVNALLQEDVFLTILDVFVVVLSSQHTFLLFQNVELATDNHELLFQKAMVLC